jgi:dUTP pyrophosphatase
MTALDIRIVRLAHGADLPLPQYHSDLAAGCDLLAAVDTDLLIAPGRFAPVPTGIMIALPPGTEAQVRPRSGLAARAGVTVLNAPGTIDADYRGEITVLLVNFGAEPFIVRRGARIAQLIIAPILRARWTPTQALDATLRGDAGFGSTGSGADGAPDRPSSPT